MVERVSVLIDSKALTSETVDPEAQVSQQCAKLVSALSVLETFCKTGEGALHFSWAVFGTRADGFRSVDKCVADQLRRVVTTIPILSKRRSQDLAPESHTKIDKVLERLRYVATRQLKGGRRLDQLITNVGDTKPALSEVDAGLLALLKALAAHVGVLNKCFSGSAVRSLPIRFRITLTSCPFLDRTPLLPGPSAIARHSTKEPSSRTLSSPTLNSSSTTASPLPTPSPTSKIGRAHV